MYYHFLNSEYPNGCVRESKVEKPQIWQHYESSYRVPIRVYNVEYINWERQLSPPIKCTSPLGENGILVEEGKDFEFEYEINVKPNRGVFGKSIHDKERVAVPLKKNTKWDLGCTAPMKDETMWDEVEETIRLSVGLDPYRSNKITDYLKSKYSITRKVNQ